MCLLFMLPAALHIIMDFYSSAYSDGFDKDPRVDFYSDKWRFVALRLHEHYFDSSLGGLLFYIIYIIEHQIDTLLFTVI